MTAALAAAARRFIPIPSHGRSSSSSPLLTQPGRGAVGQPQRGGSWPTLTGDTLDEVTAATELGIQPIRGSYTGLLVPTALRPVPMVSSDHVAGTSEVLLE